MYSDPFFTPAMIRVLLIRHGETPWNRERRWQGQADVALSDLGLEQAGRLAGHLREHEPFIHWLYSSDLSRARQTAERIGAALGVPPTLEPAWREMEVGCWTGLAREEIRDRFPQEWARIAAGEDLPRGGGERFDQFTDRIVAALETLRRRHRPDDTVAVVTHGGVIRAALLHAFGLPFSALREIAFVLNTGVTELLAHEEGWHVVRQNQTPHLPETAA